MRGRLSGESCCLRVCARPLDIARSVLESLGFVSEPRKENPPADWGVFLGVEIDLIEGRMRLDAVKRRRYAACAGSSFRPRCRDGSLSGCSAGCSSQRFAFRVPASGSTLRGRWCSTFRLSADGVKVTKAVQADLRRWLLA